MTKLPPFMIFPRVISKQFTKSINTKELYMGGTKLEANTRKTNFVWKKDALITVLKEKQKIKNKDKKRGTYKNKN